MVANVGPRPAKSFVWMRVTRDLRNGGRGAVEMLSKAKLIKIKVQMIASVFAFNV